MVIAFSIYLFANIIATAPSNNSFVNKSRSGMKGLPSSRHKWCKMAKNGDNMGFFGKWQENGVIIA